jgi:predicted deacylase
MSVTAAARPIALGTVTVVAAAVLRAWQRRWGATDDEVNRTLPGDDLISHADLTATRAITIHATAAQV